MVDERIIGPWVVRMLELGFDEVLVKVMVMGDMDVDEFWRIVSPEAYDNPPEWAKYRKEYRVRLFSYTGATRLFTHAEPTHTRVKISDFGKEVLTWWTKRNSQQS